MEIYEGARGRRQTYGLSEEIYPGPGLVGFIRLTACSAWPLATVVSGGQAGELGERTLEMDVAFSIIVHIK